VAAVWSEMALTSGGGETAAGVMRANTWRGGGELHKNLCSKAWPAAGVGGGWCSPRRWQWRVGGVSVRSGEKQGVVFIGG
jgi:hypothetical protein